MLKGIDVSQWQGAIDWKQAATAVDFAILRAGYGTTVDPQFNKNYTGASQNGVPIGVYWYCYAHTAEAARDEAQACIKALKGKAFAYPIFYDIEEETIFAQGKLTVSNIAKAFFQEMKSATSKQLGLYASASPLNQYFLDTILSNYDVWVAHYGVSSPAYKKKYTMWQYSATGSIPGIAGDVDLDWCYKDYTGGGLQSAVVSQSEYAYNDSISTVPVAELLDATDIKAYIATIDRRTRTLNATDLKSANVSGVLIEAGYLFDSSHMRTTFASPTLDGQVAFCKANTLPYGLYMTARAKTTNEVIDEMWWFARYIQKYVPPLGVWIVPEFSTSKAINDNLLDAYKSALEKLGLRKKIGIYATKSQLAKITWKNKCDDWYLWLNAHVPDISELDGILFPEFFMLDPATATPRPAVSSAVVSATQQSTTPQAATGGKTITVPASVKQSGITGNYTNYSYYYGRWAKSSIQYQLSVLWGNEGKPSKRNIATISGYYLLAVSSTFGTTGDAITVYLQNGDHFEAIVADAKGTDAKSPYGHIFGNGTVDIIEWEKKGSPYKQVDNSTVIDLTGWQGQKVTKIVNHGRYKGLK